MRFLIIILMIIALALSGQDIQSGNGNEMYDTITDRDTMEYGNVISYTYDNFSLNGENYIRVGMLEGDPELSEGVAGFYWGDYYSEIFPLKNYTGLVAVYDRYCYKTDLFYYFTPTLYASVDLEEIPAELIDEFPHGNILPTWIDGIETKK